MAVYISSYLNAFNPCLNPQLFHQFPGLGDVISGRHTDPSEYTNTGENWMRERKEMFAMQTVMMMLLSNMLARLRLTFRKVRVTPGY